MEEENLAVGRSQQQGVAWAMMVVYCFWVILSVVAIRYGSCVGPHRSHVGSTWAPLRSRLRPTPPPASPAPPARSEEEAALVEAVLVEAIQPNFREFNYFPGRGTIHNVHGFWMGSGERKPPTPPLPATALL